ncbi:MAG TPA: TetR/AcrR family transcriptional regulator [Thermoleophilaceae bacterium]
MPVSPATPSYSRLEPDARRDLILDAAKRVFVRSSAAEASTAAVAREAGVTRGLVHHYFGTKRELYVAVVADLAASLPDLVRTDVSGLPIERMVDANVTSWLDAVERDRELWVAILGVEMVGRDPEVEAIMADARDAVIDRMAGNQARGGEPTAELRLVLRVFLGAAEAAAREWAMHGRASREQAHAVLKGTLLAMVGQVLPAVPAA